MHQTQGDQLLKIKIKCNAICHPEFGSIRQDQFIFDLFFFQIFGHAGCQEFLDINYIKLCSPI